MIAVTVHDVIVRVPKDEEVKWLGEAEDWDKFHGAWIVLLKEQTGERIVPFWVGIAEGNAIAMLLADVVTPRPFTFELMAQLVEASGAKVEKIAVTSLRDNIFYATIWVNVNGRVREIDARPSDAVALALRVKASIFVTPEVMEQVSEFLLRTRDILDGLEALQRKAIEEHRSQPEEVALEYRSFRSLPRGDASGWLKAAEK